MLFSLSASQDPKPLTLQAAEAEHALADGGEGEVLLHAGGGAGHGDVGGVGRTKGDGVGEDIGVGVHFVAVQERTGWNGERKERSVRLGKGEVEKIT